MKRVYFVRHGEAEGNIGKFSQNAETPLTEKGVIQATKVGERLKSLTVDTLIASNYLRAQQTAAEISQAIDLPIETSEHFHELKNPSRIEGASHDSEEYQSHHAVVQQNYTNPEWENEDGENFVQILERARAGAEFLENHPSENIVVVSHGRFLRFFLSYVFHQKQLTAEIEQLTHRSSEATNTGITHYRVEGDHWKLISWNDHAHFAE